MAGKWWWLCCKFNKKVTADAAIFSMSKVNSDYMYCKKIPPLIK